MFQLSLIQHILNEQQITLGNLSDRDKLPIYQSALEYAERVLDVSDRDKLTKEEINLLLTDFIVIIASLHDLKDTLRRRLSDVNRRHEKRKLIENALSALESVLIKIRLARDELYTTSGMQDAGKMPAFRRSCSNFQGYLSQTSGAFIPLRILVSQIDLSKVLNQAQVEDRDQGSRHVGYSVSLGESIPPQPKETEELDGTILSEKAVKYEVKIIRELLMKGLSDDDFNDLCDDEFRSVSALFATGMNRQQKVSSLLKYIDRTNQVDKLLAEIQNRAPEKYQQYESRLLSN